MQLIALDDNQPVAAERAFKQRDYSCPECGEKLRLRAGSRRMRHFYHLNSEKKCSQNQKSLLHLQVQWQLQEKLNNSDAERRFPEINRIADVFWEPERIVFEVQCSPISAEEVTQRNADYGSLGIQVVWILHDRRYNRRYLSDAEEILQKNPHYYTNIDRHGEGFIYDQYSYHHKGVRHEKDLQVKVDLSLPKKFHGKTHGFPRFLVNRSRYWHLHFAGDLLDQVDCKSALLLEKKWNRIFRPKRRWLHFLFVRPYLSVLRFLLEVVNQP